MNGISDLDIWIVIFVMGAGTFLIRWSFLGAIGNRELPSWALRLLRYTPVAVLPALVAPLVMWPAATEGQIDPARLAAAVATITIGVFSRNVLLSILGGAVILFAMLYLLG